MSMFEKIVDLKDTFEGKLLAVFMAVVLVLTMTNVYAFATGEGKESKPQVTFDLDAGAQVSVVRSGGNQPLTGSNPKVNVDSGGSITFLVELTDGYEVAKGGVTATADKMAVDVKSLGNNQYTIAGIDSEITVTVNTVEPVAPIVEQTVETIVDQGPAAPTTEGTPEGRAARNLPAPQNEPIPQKADLTDKIDLVYRGTAYPALDSVITVPSGIQVDALINLGLETNAGDSYIVAIPLATGSLVDYGFVDGAKYTTVSGDKLGFDADTKYAVAVFTYNSHQSLIQGLPVSVGFPNGTTPDGATQTLEAYLFKGTADGSNPLGDTGISVDTNYNNKKAKNVYTVKADVETHAITKTIKSITDGTTVLPVTGGVDPKLDADPEALNFGTSGGTYTIEYEVAITSDKNLSENGRLYVADGAKLKDVLSNVLGNPSSITITATSGANANTNKGSSVNSPEATAPLALSDNKDGKGKVLDNQTYKVVVVYNQDDYTDFYAGTPVLVNGARQKITNTASLDMSYSTSTPLPESGTAINAIGYIQNSPNNITYVIDKTIGYVDEAGVQYNAAAQAAYPTSETVTFTMTELDDQGAETSTVLTATLDGEGQATFTGLKSNTTYLLEETVGVDGFNKINNQKVKIVAGNNTLTITTTDDVTNDEQTYGTSFVAANTAINSGKATVNVQAQTVDGITIGDYAALEGKVVTVLDGTTVVATGTTDASGNVSFNYLNTSKDYSITVDGVDAGYYLASGELAIKAEKYKDNEQTVDLKYNLEKANLSITKTFEGIGDDAVTNLEASFVVKVKGQGKYLAADGTLVDTVADANTITVQHNNTVQFPALVPAGEYTIVETKTTDTENQYTLKNTDIKLKGGERLTETIVNTSTKARVSIGKTFTGPSTSYAGYSAVFELRDEDGNSFDPKMTIEVTNGTTEKFPLLNPGTYTLFETEVKAGEGQDIEQFPATWKKEKFTLSAKDNMILNVGNASTKGGLSIEKKFAGVETYTGFVADFMIYQMVEGNKVYVKNVAGTDDLVVSVEAGKKVNLPVLLPDGNYVIEEVAVKDASGVDATGQFALQADTAVTVEEGKAKTETITNTSNRGELTIQNFDYKAATSANLTAGTYTYKVTNAANFEETVVLAEGEAKKTIVVPAGVYTVEFVSGPADAQPAGNVGTTVTVAGNTKSSGSAKVAGKPLALDLDGATQTAAFMYGWLADVNGKKVKSTTTTLSTDGAVFELYMKDSAGDWKTTGKTSTVANTTLATFEDLQPGEYKLVETTVPEGFVKPAYVTAVEKATTQGELNTALTNAQGFTVTYVPLGTGVKSIGNFQNTPFAHVEIDLKSTETGVRLADGVFEIKDSNNVVLGTATTTADGTVKFMKDGKEVDLAPGTYTVSQTGGVDGYIPRTDTVAVTVSAQGNVTLAGFNNTDPDYANDGLTATNGSGVITYSNLPFAEVTTVKQGEINVFDENGKRQMVLLEGAEFELYQGTNKIAVSYVEGTNNTYTVDYSGNASDKITSGSTGSITIIGLDPALTYTLTEVYAPDVIEDRLSYDLDKTPDVSINLETIGYEYVYVNDEAVKIKSTRLNPDIKNYIEDTAQVELEKVLVKCSVAGHYPEGNMIANQHDASKDNQACNLEESSSFAPNGEFEIWWNVGTDSEPDWVYIETIVTGTAYEGNYNKALSGDLPAGSYRLIETKSPMDAAAIGENGNNHLYEYDDEGNIVNTISKDADGKLVYNFTITAADIKAANSPDGTGLINIKLGNDDGRGQGGGGSTKYIQLYGQKMGYSAYNTEGSPLSMVKFDVYLGYIDENGNYAPLYIDENGNYATTDVENKTEISLSEVFSSMVKGDKAGWMTQVVNLAAYVGTDKLPDTTRFAFKLIEKGPLPHNYRQSAIGSEHIVTLPAYNTIETSPTVLKYDTPDVEGAIIANYEDGAKIGITKYDAEGNEALGSEFELYHNKSGETGGNVAAPTIKGNAASYTEVLAGNYTLLETVAPKGYNPNGAYKAVLYKDVEYEADGTVKRNEDGTIKASEANSYEGYFNERVVEGRIGSTINNGEGIQLERNSLLLVEVTDNPFASLTLNNFLDGNAFNNDQSATYNISYTGSYESFLPGAITSGPVTVNTATTFNGLPDGEYLIEETAVNPDSYINKNVKASGEGIKVIIVDGKITNVQVHNGEKFDDVTDEWGEPTDNNVTAGGTGTAAGTVNVNHLTKTKLVIQKGHVDSAGYAKDLPGDITEAIFKVTWGENEEQTLTWKKVGDTITAPSMYLENGVTYTVTEQTDLVSSPLEYTIDSTPVTVIGSETGVVYLQNKTAEKDPAKKALGTPDDQTSGNNNNPTKYYFYNKVKAAQLTITKTDTKNATIKAAGTTFVMYTKDASGVNNYVAVDAQDKPDFANTTINLSEAYEFVTDETGTVVVKDIPQAATGDTEYYVKETVAPAGYYLVDTEQEVTLTMNKNNTVSVKNPALAKLTVNKVTDGEEPVAGQVIELHELNGASISETPVATTAVGSKTGTDGSIEFTGLTANADGSAKSYVVVEKESVNTLLLNADYIEKDSYTAHITVSYENGELVVKKTGTHNGAFANNTLTIKNPTLGALTVNKITDDGKGGTEALNGQIVELYRVNADNTKTLISTPNAVTSDGGKITFTGLAPTSYTVPAYYMVVEKESNLDGVLLNEAYVDSETPIQHIEVSYDDDATAGLKVKVEATDEIDNVGTAGFQNGVLTIKNPKKDQVTIHKISDKAFLKDGKTVNEVSAIDGQAIALYRIDGDGKYTEVTHATGKTDTNGNITFTGLYPTSKTTPAEYMVVETSSLPYLTLDSTYTTLPEKSLIGHIEVSYDDDETAGLKVKVEATDNINKTLPEGYVAWINDTLTKNTLTINNPYNNQIIAAQKVDISGGKALAGAEFKLVYGDGKDVLDINNKAVTATSGEDGYAYFQYTPAAEPPTGDIYILETKAPDGYLLSPYKSEIMKKVSFVDNKAQIVKFEDRKVVTEAPALGLTKTGANATEPLALNDFVTSFTITPQAVENTVPLQNYTVTDKGIAFANGDGAVTDNRVKYTVNSITVAEPTSGTGNDMVVSFDKGENWNTFTDDGTFVYELATKNYNASKIDSLFDVVYGEVIDGKNQPIVGTNFTPGAITVSVTFNQFAQKSDSELIKEITKITNSATVSAQYQNKDGWSDATPPAKDAVAKVTLPTVEFGELSVSKSVNTDKRFTNPVRGGYITYSLKVKNASSETAVKNPVVIDSMLNSNGLIANVENGVIKDAAVTSDDPGITSVEGKSVAVDDRLIVWDFEGQTLGAGKTITITVKLIVEEVTDDVKVNNDAYATSKITESNPAVYTKDNPSGARFVPADEKQIVKSDEYSEIAEKSGINGLILVKDSEEFTLTTGYRFTVQRAIQDPASSAWITSKTPVDHNLGGEINYRLSLFNDYHYDKATDLEFYEILPYYGYEGTTLPQDFIERMQIKPGSIVVKVAGTVLGSDKYEILYTTDAGLSYSSFPANAAMTTDATNATGFKVIIDKSIELPTSQSAVVEYVLTIPDLDLSTKADHDLMNLSAYKVADAKFKTSFDVPTMEDRQSMTSKNVVARIIPEAIGMSGTVWDDESNVDPTLNRNDILDADDARIEGATVTLYERMKGSNDEDAWTVKEVAITNAQGGYEFENLVSSYGEGKDGAMEYKVVVEPNVDATISQISAGVAFVSGTDSTQNNSHMLNSTIDAGAITADSGVIEIYNAPNIVNAGVREIPKVTYFPGNAPTSTVTNMPGVNPQQNDSTRTGATYTVEGEEPKAEGYKFGGWYAEVVPNNGITPYPPATIDGYTYQANGQFVMTEFDVNLTAMWEPEDGTDYKVQHFLQTLENEDAYVQVGETETHKGTTDSLTNDGKPRWKEFTGFSRNLTHPQSNHVDVVRGDGSTLLKYYYDRNAYEVAYRYTGVVPTGAPDVPERATYKFGQTVNVADNATLPLYTFSGWASYNNEVKWDADERTFDMPVPANGEVLWIEGSWTIDPVPPFIPPADDTTATPAGPLAAIVIPVATALAAPIEALIGDAATPLAEGAAIDDDETPLAGIFCWVHYYILLGIIITAVYSVAVLLRRRKFISDLNKYEQTVLEGELEKGTGTVDNAQTDSADGRVPAGN